MRWLVLLVLAVVPLAAAGAERPHVYLVVIDGLGSDLVDPALMPRLTDPALCAGRIGEARAGMPARTNPSHVTLLAGALPESHGVTGNGYWDRASGTARPLDVAALLEMETLFTVAATTNPRLATVAAFSKARIGRLFVAVPDRQHAPDVLWVPRTDGPAGHLTGVASDAETMDAFLSAAAEREPHLAAVNLSEVDRTAHEQGPAATADARRRADAAFGRLVDDLRARGRWGRAVVIVTADHGFDAVAPTPERPDPNVVLAARFAREGLTGIHVVSDGGVAHVYADGKPADAAPSLAWAASVAWRETGVAEVFARIPVPGMPDLAQAHPEWGLGHERAGDLLVVARPGYQLVDPADASSQRFRGNHGSPRETRVPLVITGGALAKPRCAFAEPPSHADLGATIAALLRLRPPRRFDGRDVRAGTDLKLTLTPNSRRARATHAAPARPAAATRSYVPPARHSRVRPCVEATPRRGSKTALREVVFEDALRGVGERADVVRRLRDDALHVGAGLGHVALRVGLLRQARNDRLGELEVELEAVDDLAPAEGLLLVDRGGRQVDGVGGQLVGVAVEVEHGERRVAADEERVVPAVVRERDGRPPDLAPVARIDACAQHLGDDLRPQAYPEHGSPRGDRLFDQHRLGAEEGILVLLVRPHRATQHDQAAQAAEVLRDRLAACEVECTVMNASLAQRVPEQPDALGLRVPEHQPRRTFPGSVRVLVPPCHPRPVSLTAG
jgi:arylsulfatase A-like enzyme